MNSWGSALPEFKDASKLHLVIADEQEFEFGRVFFYETREFIDSGDISAALAGDAPVIFDRNDGQSYVTGTAYPLAHYIEEYRNSVRHRDE